MKPGPPTGYKYATQVCVRCGRRKALRAFYRDQRNPSGKAVACKKCVKARQAEQRIPTGYLRHGPVPQTPYVPPGTLHPVWRCEFCNCWQQRNGGPAPVCMNCSEPDPDLPAEIAHAVGAYWVAPDDQVFMVEAMRLAPPNRRHYTVCPKCGRGKSWGSDVCRVCYRQGLAPKGFEAPRRGRDPVNGFYVTKQ